MDLTRHSLHHFATWQSKCAGAYLLSGTRSVPGCQRYVSSPDRSKPDMLGKDSCTRTAITYALTAVSWQLRKPLQCLHCTIHEPAGYAGLTGQLLAIS